MMIAARSKIRRRQSIHVSKGDRLFYALNDLFLVLVFVVCLYPIFYILAASLSSSSAVNTGKVYLWPVEFTFNGYEGVLRNPRIMSGYWNTFQITVIGTLVNVVSTVMIAYPLSRKDMLGRNAIMYLFTFTMLFSGGLIPSYMLVREIGLMDSIWALIIPGAISVYQVIVTRTFFVSTIPDELYEAATIDGCSHITFLIKMVLPLSKAILAVLVLMYAIGHWNAYFDSLLYIQSPNKIPLQRVLRGILASFDAIDVSGLEPELQQKLQDQSDLIRYSSIIIASLPVWLLYPFIQKYFVKGVMIGAIKG